MTQVQSIRFDNTGKKLDFVKVTYKNGQVSLLDTDERGDAVAVLADLERGDFDECIIWSESPSHPDVAAWDEQHPNAVTVYGE